MKLTQDNMMVLALAGVALYFITQQKKTKTPALLKTNSNGLANPNQNIMDYFNTYKPEMTDGWVSSPIDLGQPTSRVTDV